MSADPRISGRPLLEPEAAAMLADAGIDYVAHGLATTAAGAAEVAAGLGWPVVLKVVSPDIVHKSDAGGVVTGLAGEDEVARAFEALMSRLRERLPEARLEGALVCRQVTHGVEMIVGAVRDATFGPTVMVGAGGVFAEALGDVAFRVAPLHPDDAQDMLRELRAYKVLTGWRGMPPVDLEALAGTAVKLGDLMRARPEVAEVDLNPVLASEDGCVALDARIILTPEGTAAGKPLTEGAARTTDGETT